MISGLAALFETQPNGGLKQQTVNLSLDRGLYDLLVNAMKEHGLDPTTLGQEDGGPRRNLVTGPATLQPAATAMTATPAAAPTATPAHTPAAPSTINVADETAFKPKFMEATLNFFDQKFDLNPEFFATRETAEWIAKKFGTGEIQEVAVGGEAYGPRADEKQFHIRVADGRLVNAGYLASYYVRHPPDKCPGAADQLINMLLESGA